jgi:hypothetical protein
MELRSFHGLKVGIWSERYLVSSMRRRCIIGPVVHDLLILKDGCRVA